MLIFSFSALVSYFGSIILFHTYFNTAIIDQRFIAKILIITVAAWAPFQIIQWLKSKIDPTEEEKIQKQEY